MNIVMNFYIQSEDVEDSYQELLTGVSGDNSLYLSLQTGDIIIPPENQDSEFVIDKIVKNLCTGEMDVYLSETKDVGELFEEIGVFANNTLKHMFDTLKINIPDPDGNENNKETINKPSKYLEDASYREVEKDK